MNVSIAQITGMSHLIVPSDEFVESIFLSTSAMSIFKFVISVFISSIFFSFSSSFLCASLISVVSSTTLVLMISSFSRRW